MSPWNEVADQPEPNRSRTDEVTWDSRRTRKTWRVALLSEVRRRDGDQCRACRTVVDFLDRKSASGGAYYLEAPQFTATPEAAFVVCRRCLSASFTRGPLQILPAPERPVYSGATVSWLDRYLVGGVSNRDGYHSADTDVESAVAVDGHAHGLKLPGVDVADEAAVELESDVDSRPDREVPASGCPCGVVEELQVQEETGPGVEPVLDELLERGQVIVLNLTVELVLSHGVDKRSHGFPSVDASSDAA